MDRRIKEFTLGIRTILFHGTRLWSESVIIMIWPFSFKAACQRENIMKMDKDEKTPDNKFSGVEF